MVVGKGLYMLKQEKFLVSHLCQMGMSPEWYRYKDLYFSIETTCYALEYMVRS